MIPVKLQKLKLDMKCVQKKLWEGRRFRKIALSSEKKFTRFTNLNKKIQKKPYNQTFKHMSKISKDKKKLSSLKLINYQNRIVNAYENKQGKSLKKKSNITDNKFTNKFRKVKFAIWSI